MNKIKEALRVVKKCKHCGGYLEPKFGDYHPICKQFALNVKREKENEKAI